MYRIFQYIHCLHYPCWSLPAPLLAEYGGCLPGNCPTGYTAAAAHSVSPGQPERKMYIGYTSTYNIIINFILFLLLLSAQEIIYREYKVS